MIKVDSLRSTETARTGRARPASAGGPAFTLDRPEETTGQLPVSSTSTLSGVDALLALQGVGDALEGRTKAARRGRDMLDLLDDIRKGMLTGQISRTTLTQLARLADEQREEFQDPGLTVVLDEIDLRARVELAKFESAQETGRG